MICGGRIAAIVAVMMLLWPLPIMAQQAKPPVRDLSLVQDRTESVEDRLQGELQRQRDQRDEALRAPPSGAVIELEQPGVATEEDACLPVRSVTIEGMSLLNPEAFAEAADRLVGSCTPVADVNGLLRALTNAYVGAGYVTTRAVISQDGLPDSDLTIVVLEGRIEGIRPEGEALTRREAALALAQDPGDVLDLRALEQAVDQLSLVPSRNVGVDIAPGAAPGSSVVLLKNERQGRPVRATLNTDNFGQDSTGAVTKAATVEVDRPLGLNDYWSVTASHNEADDGRGEARALSVYAAIPYQYWTATLSGGAFDYETLVEGSGTRFESSGESWNANLRLDRLVHRDQRRKVTLSGGLALTDTANFIEGTRLLASSYRLAVLTAGMVGQQQVGGGSASATLEYRRGVDALDATSIDFGEGGPQRVFDKVAARGSYVRPFSVVGDRPARLSVQAAGQWSPDELFPAERFAIGSRTTVRSFTDGGLSGESGYLLRTELSTQLASLEFAEAVLGPAAIGILAAYDYGAVIEDEDAVFERGHLSGASVGLTFGSRRIDAAITVSEPLDAPSFFPLPDTEIAFSVALKI